MMRTGNNGIMTDTNMPVTEAAVDTPEVLDYELAFHVLPTVAEGEVANVVTALKALVAADGGTITTEEAPQRFELAYPIEKRFEGKFRSYKSAYFGWVRFTATPAAVTGILREVEAHPEVLRALLVKLTAAEVAHPFYFHEALAQKRVVTVDATTDAPADDAAAEVDETESEEATTEEAKD